VFIHGTDLVNRGLIAPFFGLFCYFLLPLPRLIVLFFWYFLLFFSLFSVAPFLEIFQPTPLTIKESEVKFQQWRIRGLRTRVKREFYDLAKKLNSSKKRQDSVDISVSKLMLITNICTVQTWIDGYPFISRIAHDFAKPKLQNNILAYLVYCQHAISRENDEI